MGGEGARRPEPGRGSWLSRSCPSAPASAWTYFLPRLVPKDDELAHLLSDYNAMRTSGIISEDAPGFDTLVKKIRDLEAAANALAHTPQYEGPSP